MLTDDFASSWMYLSDSVDLLFSDRHLALTFSAGMI